MQGEVGVMTLGMEVGVDMVRCQSLGRKQKKNTKKALDFSLP
jgi:hypothetical protein